MSARTRRRLANIAVTVLVVLFAVACAGMFRGFDGMPVFGS
ncbi:hypothetical protein Val02_81910 [Virgisporangium aliadipatigenens]|uniref:Uncharacterized protein n=1 Tax=Virgisporangium aliadipatigenens TaxID=741659 RepID=A0A8J3YX03_9ACTN|nr:hypothetical protein [Virgisporangium aliadipatigenens]GIJ51305.1 hypothetical protein Val02_81910 [Virgisporangium aliadipatigenens]